MEITLRPEIHTYSGGLGILAGDTARSCADLKLPAVFVALISGMGYLRQEIDSQGRQIEHPNPRGLAARVWMMKEATSKMAYYFNSQRMMRRYASEAYIR